MHENGTGVIFDEQVQEAPSYFEDESFPLTGLTDLRKYIKNQNIQIEARSSADTEMKEAELKKERVLQYNIYTLKDCERWFYFLKENFMKPTQTALAANVNYGTLEKTRLKIIPNKTLNIPVSKLNGRFYGNNPKRSRKLGLNSDE